MTALFLFRYRIHGDTECNPMGETVIIQTAGAEPTRDQLGRLLSKVFLEEVMQDWEDNSPHCRTCEGSGDHPDEDGGDIGSSCPTCGGDGLAPRPTPQTVDEAWERIEYSHVEHRMAVTLVED